MGEKSVERVGIVGAGSWGTALANLLAEKGYTVDMWVYEPELCRDIAEKRENTFYLPGVPIHERIVPHTAFAPVVVNHSLVVMVVPSHVYREVAEKVVPHLDQDAVVVSATKGIENDTLLTMSGVWREIASGREDVHFCCLSGPSFAREVVRRLPTVVTLACKNITMAQMAQQVFATDYFRVYVSTDVIGLEIAGAVKNVIALAAGACDGMGFGHNTRAALITRGLAEMTRLGIAMGAHPMTFLGLPGVGDLLLTCTGDLSRNRTIGYKLGQGQKLDEILADMKMVAEGVKTAKSVYFLARKLGVELPICELVYKVLYENADPGEAVQSLMGRELKHEWDREMDIFQALEKAVQ